MYKIKANEKLFNEINEIIEKMKVSLPSIMQNDTTISYKQYYDFLIQYDSDIESLNYWMAKVDHLIIKTNK